MIKLQKELKKKQAQTTKMIMQIMEEERAEQQRQKDELAAELKAREEANKGKKVYKPFVLNLHSSQAAPTNVGYENYVPPTEIIELSEKDLDSIGHVQKSNQQESDKL